MSTTTRRLTLLPTGLCLIVMLGANALAIALAWQDQSWGALGIAMLVAPIGNLILAVVSALAAIPFLNRPSFRLARHLALSVLVPALLAGADYLLILAMPLHGC